MLSLVECSHLIALLSTMVSKSEQTKKLQNTNFSQFLRYETTSEIIDICNQECTLYSALRSNKLQKFETSATIVTKDLSYMLVSSAS